MSFPALCGVGILALSAATVLRSVYPNAAKWIGMFFTIYVGFTILTHITDALALARSMLDAAELDDSFTVPLKALGIAYLTYISAEICRDSGEDGIASKVELAGKIEMLSLALPLVKNVFLLGLDLLS